MDFSKIDIENNQNKTAELVPFSIKKSTVLLETNTHTNNTSNNNIKYISAIDNNKIICTNCILPSATQYFAYAETNSNIVIDDKSLIKTDNKQKYGQFIANKNSFINYNLNIKNIDNIYLPSLYNNGEKYITYTFNKTNNDGDVNNVYYVPPENDKTIQINVERQPTLSETIDVLQKEIDSIPSVLNGYTLEINLSVLGGYTTNFSINTPLKIKNFYQGKIKIIFDKAMGTINFSSSNSKIDFTNDLNIHSAYYNSSDDPNNETYISFSTPLLIISDVDNCEFYSTDSENGNIIFKLSNPSVIDKTVIPMIIINNVNNFETNCNITFKSNLNETDYKTYNLISKCNSLRKFNTCIYDFICGIYFKLTTAKLKQIIINEQPIHCALFNDFSTIYADNLLIGYNMTSADYR